jgi:hypothetical protein
LSFGLAAHPLEGVFVNQKILAGTHFRDHIQCQILIVNSDTF